VVLGVSRKRFGQLGSARISCVSLSRWHADIPESFLLLRQLVRLVIRRSLGVSSAAYPHLEGPPKTKAEQQRGRVGIGETYRVDVIIYKAPLPLVIHEPFLLLSRHDPSERQQRLNVVSCSAPCALRTEDKKRRGAHCVLLDTVRRGMFDDEQLRQIVRPKRREDVLHQCRIIVDDRADICAVSELLLAYVAVQIQRQIVSSWTTVAADS
jgi:hypothetical protein